MPSAFSLRVEALASSLFLLGKRYSFSTSVYPANAIISHRCIDFELTALPAMKIVLALTESDCGPP
mgnify:CR=1 FL=1